MQWYSFLLCLATVLPVGFSAAWPTSFEQLPKNWESTVVMLEKCEERNGQHIFKPLGTGFLFHDSITKMTLITNKHVIGDRDSLFIRFNVSAEKAADGSGVLRHPCRLRDRSGKQLWLSHPNPAIDIAAVQLIKPKEKHIDFAVLEYRWFRPFDSVSVGDDIYFFGFPMLNGGEQSKGDFPIMRSGIVAFKAMQETNVSGIHIDSGTMLIDGFSFGGNSGSPVWARGDGGSKAAFVGIVAGHIPYSYHTQVKVDSIPFEIDDTTRYLSIPALDIQYQVNSGLAVVYCSDYVRQVLEELK